MMKVRYFRLGTGKWIKQFWSKLPCTAVWFLVAVVDETPSPLMQFELDRHPQ